MTGMEQIPIQERQACQNRPSAMASVACGEITGVVCTQMSFLQTIYLTCSLVVEVSVEVVSTMVSSLGLLWLTLGPFGPGFQAGFGGPGIRIHRFGGARPRRQEHHPQQQRGNSSVLYQLLPVLLDRKSTRLNSSHSS